MEPEYTASDRMYGSDLGVSGALYYHDPYVGEGVEAGGLAILAIIKALADRRDRFIMMGLAWALGLMAVLAWFI